MGTGVVDHESVAGCFVDVLTERGQFFVLLGALYTGTAIQEVSVSGVCFLISIPGKHPLEKRMTDVFHSIFVAPYSTLNAFLCFSKLCPKGAVGNVYRTNRGYPQPCLQYTQLPDNIIPMLRKLGPYVSIDPVLMVKVIRVFKGFMKEVCTFYFFLFRLNPSTRQ